MEQDSSPTGFPAENDEETDSNGNDKEKTITTLAFFVFGFILYAVGLLDHRGGTRYFIWQRHPNCSRDIVRSWAICSNNFRMPLFRPSIVINYGPKDPVSCQNHCSLCPL